jgi:hypothetical protein
VVLRDMAVGGVPRLYVDVCRRLIARGVRATICADDGPTVREADEAGVEVVRINWSDGQAATFDAVTRAAAERDADAAIVLCDPLLLPVVPAAWAGAGRVLVAVHSSVRSLAREWFAPAELDHLGALARAMMESGSGTLSARGSAHVAEVASTLDIDASRVAIVAPGVRTDRLVFEPRVPPRDATVLVLSRLSPEVAQRIQAGVALVAGGRAAGRNCTLRLVGDGPWREQAIALCRDRIGETGWAVDPLTDDPYGTIQAADVVVASNLTSLEASALGRPVVAARRSGSADDDSVLGPLIGPGNFGLLSDDIFGTTLPAADPGQVWQAIDAVDEPHLAQVRAQVERLNSSEAQAEAFLARLAALRPEPSRAALAALGRGAAQAADDTAQARATADELWRARDWYEGQLAALRSAAGEREVERDGA